MKFTREYFFSTIKKISVEFPDLSFFDNYVRKKADHIKNVDIYLSGVESDQNCAQKEAKALWTYCVSKCDRKQKHNQEVL